MSKDLKPVNNYLRFTSVGIQMGAVIGLSVWLGTWLDAKYHVNGSWWTLGLSLFGVFAGLYLVIKEVFAMQKREEQQK